MTQTTREKPRRGRVIRRAVRATLSTVGPWLIAIVMLLLRATCRARLHNDPRPALRAAKRSYIYSVLHAHQLAAATCGDRNVAAMVSQSRDGAYVALGLKAVGIKPIRGSSRREGRDNGGLAALVELIRHVRSGNPAYLAVDGPRGPRNRVHKGIAVLSQKSDAVVLNVVVVPSRRWIVRRSWDRFQIPWPFCRIDTYFTTVTPQANESVEEYRKRIERSLSELEQLHDASEASLANTTTRANRRRAAA